MGCSSSRTEAGPTAQQVQPMDLQKGTAGQKQASPPAVDAPAPVDEPAAAGATDEGQEAPDAVAQPAPVAQPGAKFAEPPPEPVGVPEPQDEPEIKRKRDPKHVFEIKFKKRPLGVVLTSARNGKSAYVTQTAPWKNKAVKKKKLPHKSKLLKVNDLDVENDKIDKITQLILQDMRNPPLVLTFCHPKGLDPDEIPDPNPKEDFTRQKADS